MTIEREEIFGSISYIILFDAVSEALALANATEYGLGNSEQSTNISTVMTIVDGIQARTVRANCYGLLDPAVSFRGYKSRGYGWKGGPSQIDDYHYQKAAYINISWPTIAFSACYFGDSSYPSILPPRLPTGMRLRATSNFTSMAGGSNRSTVS